MILETKLLLPKPKAGTLLRTGLLELIKNNLDKKLVLITAGAGYGKTTLLGQLIKEARMPCVFYDLDKSDSDLPVFYSYLVNGIKQIDPELVKYSEELVHQGAKIAKNAELLFGTMINELHERRKEELFIVLDNYHNIAEDSAVHSALDFFIDHLPEKIHVIIASRSVSSLPTIARWRAKQDLYEIAREDLAFSGDEIVALLRVAYKTVLPGEDLHQMAVQTEGWITGIQLVLQSSGQNRTTFRENLRKQFDLNQPLFEYFANEILRLETPVLNDFLTKCSILCVMTPGACDAIMDVKISERTLKMLERRHLFITATGTEEYKCHHLFREFLQKQLKGEDTALHRKAAAYYQRQGNAAQAIEHYLEAKDFGRAGALICNIADEMIDRAQFNVLDNWVQRIPEGTFVKHPELLEQIAELRRAEGRLEEAGTKCRQAIQLLKKKGNVQTLALALLEQARLLWSKYDHHGTLKMLRHLQTVIKDRRIEKHFGEWMKGDIFNLSALALAELGDYAKAQSYYLRALQIREYVGNNSTCFIVESNLAMLYALQGEERLAYDVYHALIARIGGNYFYKAGDIFATAAISAINHGNMTWAEQSLEQGRALCRPYNDAGSQAYLDYGYGYLNIQKAQWETALHHLVEAADRAAGLEYTYLHCGALRDICRVYRYQGDYAKAREYLEKAFSSMGGKTSGQFLATLNIEQGLLEAGRGEIKKAERIVRGCLVQSRKYGWGRMAFMTLLAGATLYAGQKKEKQAIIHLRQAIRMSKLKGYDGILMRELRAAPKLIGLAKKMKAEPEYMNRIISECEKHAATTVEPLLTAKMLGGFELTAGGANVRLNRKTTKAILSFILLHPRNSYTWESIAAWVWPESEAHASHLMFKRDICEIYGCSPAVKSAISSKDYHYSLKLDCRLWVDAVEFQSLLEQSEKAASEGDKMRILEQATGLYRGPLLPDLYYDWIDSLRNSLEARYASALGLLAQWHYQKQQYERSIHFCLQYLETNELDEKIHSLLIANYILQGHNSRALKQYDRLTTLLHKHFQREPSPETASLIKNLS